MPHFTTTTILSLILPLLATAQTPTAAPSVSIYWPLGYDNPMEASIRSVSAGTTALFIQCPRGTDSNDCGLGMGVDFTIVSSKTYIAKMGETDAVFMSGQCVPNTSKSEAVCTQSIGGPEADFPGVSSIKLSGSDYNVWHEVPVTAGAELLTSSAAAGAKPTTTSDGPINTAATTTATSEPNASGTGAAPEESGAAVRLGAGSVFAGLGAMGAMAAFF